MPHQLIFLCPVCKAEDSIINSRCSQCGQIFTITPETVSFSNQSFSLPEIGTRLREEIRPEQAADVLSAKKNDLPENLAAGAFRISGKAVLRQGKEKFFFRGFAGLFTRRIEKPREIAQGVLVLSPENIIFYSPGKTLRFRWSDLRCVTTNSHFFEFTIRHHPFYQIHFLQESPLKYEILFQKILQKQYQKVGQKIVEFQPALRLTVPRLPGAFLPVSSGKTVRQFIGLRLLARLLRSLLKTFFQFMLRVKVKNEDYFPRNFPFVLLANHQSFFDPFLILTFLYCRIAFLTKSTSFCNPFERFILKIGMGIPTTRYKTDPQVIAIIRRFLAGNISVGIFPEGERSWDGEMKHFKYSVIKLLVALRAPVVPVILQGAFSFFPRWDSSLHRTTVELRVTPPFCLVPNLFSLEELKNFVEDQFRS